VDRLYLPADFIILDMEEDREVPIILSRPFLATGNTLIDVRQGKLTLRVQDDEVTFNVFDEMKYPMVNEDCFSIDMVDKLTMETFREEHPTLSLEECIAHSDTNTKEDYARERVCMNYLKTTRVYSKKEDFMELKHILPTPVPSI